jgi:hypothetical protein
VLRIRDSFPDSGSDFFSSRIRIFPSRIPDQVPQHLFNPKNCLQALKNKDLKTGTWEPGYEIRDPRNRIRHPEKTYSGSRIQGSKKASNSGSAIILTTLTFKTLTKKITKQKESLFIVLFRLLIDERRIRIRTFD